MSISSALNIARSGLQVQELNVAVKSQNLSAQGVDGYKRQYLVIQDLPYQDFEKAGATTSSEGGNTNPTGMQVGMGVKPVATFRSFEGGDLIKTENELDIAIQGSGFFQITMPDGTTAYTRAGIFQPDSQGNIVSIHGGYKLSPNMTIPANHTGRVMISDDGQVSVSVTGQTAPQIIGQIQLATFINPNGLRAMGENLFAETSASGTPVVGNPGTNQIGTLMAGWREGSNVNSVEEITDLIKIQRLYEMLTKVLNAGDAMMEAANRVGR